MRVRRRESWKNYENLRLFNKPECIAFNFHFLWPVSILKSSSFKFSLIQFIRMRSVSWSWTQKVVSSQFSLEQRSWCCVCLCLERYFCAGWPNSYLKVDKVECYRCLEKVIWLLIAHILRWLIYNLMAPIFAIFYTFLIHLFVDFGLLSSALYIGKLNLNEWLGKSRIISHHKYIYRFISEDVFVRAWHRWMF